MVGVAYAAVPFYDWFCRTTGFAGRPLIAFPAAGSLERTVAVRFDANHRRPAVAIRADQIRSRSGSGQPVTGYTIVNEEDRARNGGAGVLQ